jgi:predicted O-linked N-acetylglucosamine transferase (SPINDLY family)
MNRTTSEPPPTEESVRALLRARRLEQAQTEAERLVGARPNDAEACFLLGIVQAERGNFAAALGNIRQALAADENPPWTRALALTNVLRDSGEALAAEAIARQLLEREPNRVQVHNALGLALHDQARFDEAVAAFRQAEALDRRYIPAHLNLALSLEARGDRSAAIAVVHAARAIDPGNPKLAFALATLLDHDGRRSEAKQWYLQAARLDPGGAAEAYRRLGRLLYAEADIFSAIAAYEEFVKLEDGNAEVWNLLGNAYMDIAAIAHATRCYNAALAIDPAHADIFDNLLLCHHYDPTFTADRMFDVHREWARRFASGLALKNGRPRSARLSRECLRIGFVSQSLCSGPTGFFLLPLLRHLDKARHEVFCYSAGFKNDDVSNELRGLAHHWRNVGGDSDEALARRIDNDEIDVLIDLAGHAPGNRLRAIAHKPAPVVVTWLDYFDTTGLDGVDFLIADNVSVSTDTRQRFTESVLRIDPSRLCYAPPDYAPLPAPPPLLRNGYVTFGSFNRLAKLAEPVVDLWARLLHAVPDSRLLLKSAAFNHPTTRAGFAQRFVDRGIAATRLELRGSSPHAQMFAEYADLDVALDPFPYNGGLTTCEALWMGVPVVALLGDSMISRQSAALLMAVGRREWVARTEDEWLAVATMLSRDAARLAAVRQSLRAAIMDSPLVDGARFAQHFEQLVETMVSTSASRPTIGIG